MAKLRFSGKTVLVTGAASGIGFETCLAFAREGATIIATDLNLPALSALEEAISDCAGKLQCHALDVGDAQAFEQLAKTLSEQNLLPDVLVNNAGIGYMGDLSDHTEAVWQRVLNVNLLGVVRGCRAFIPLMKVSGRDHHIVNIASLASIAPVPNMAAYAASKYAVHGFTDVLALELADTNIRVTRVHPGIINTAIVRSESAVGASVSAAQLQRLQTYYQQQGCLPDVVARDIVRAVSTQRFELFTGTLAYSTAWLKRLCGAEFFQRLLLRNARNVGYLTR